MKTNLTLDEQYNIWCSENTYAASRVIREAFLAGARYVAKDTVNLMGDYAAATAGLPASAVTPSDRYDSLGDDLQSHYDRMFRDVKWLQYITKTTTKPPWWKWLTYFMMTHKKGRWSGTTTTT